MSIFTEFIVLGIYNFAKTGDICASQAKVAPTICRSDQTPPLLSGSSGETAKPKELQQQQYPTDKTPTTNHSATKVSKKIPGSNYKGVVLKALILQPV